MAIKDITYKTWESKIEEFAKRKRIPVHGAKALNVNLPGIMGRFSKDYDIWSKSWKTHAYQLAEELGADYYHVKKLSVPGKSVYRIVRTHTGETIADFSRIPSKESYSTKQGMRYQTLLDQKRRLESILADPSKRYRHAKAQMDLRKIEYYLKEMEKR
jgi:hypothetical protein